jgi:hypothetical protein
MKTILGGICFVVGLLSAAGLFFSTVRLACFPIEGFDPVIAFVGFGAPTLVFGVASGALWEKNHQLIKCLGCSCTALGLINTFGLLAVVAGWVGLIPGISGQGVQWSEAGPLLLEFGIPMLVYGAAGIAILASETGEIRDIHISAAENNIKALMAWKHGTTAAAAREAIQAELCKLGYDGKVSWKGYEAAASVGWGIVHSASGKITDEAIVVNECGGALGGIVLDNCREMLVRLFPNGGQA